MIKCSLGVSVNSDTKKKEGNIKYSTEIPKYDIRNTTENQWENYCKNLNENYNHKDTIGMKVDERLNYFLKKVESEVMNNFNVKIKNTEKKGKVPQNVK